MQVELNLREAIRLKLMLEQNMSVLKHVNDQNYPFRQEDTLLLERLRKAADPYWNK